jgi:cation diffusion facilitator CzcD-associated flavoprotein CzcO
MRGPIARSWTTLPAEPQGDTAIEAVDVLIVGAGLSGIGAAWHLQRGCPGKTWAILEARAALGGTWDLFRYPGVRSDSDMYTLGDAFKTWTVGKALAVGVVLQSAPPYQHRSQALGHQ